jgi:hypothetical protein
MSGRWLYLPIGRIKLSMHIKYYILIALIVFTWQMYGQTTIPGGTINGATWTDAGSPYHVQGDLEIVNLTIEPGVEILFDGDYNFEITGLLAARGTYSDSIVFKSDPGNSSGWNGLFYNGSAVSNELRYCRIADASAQGGVNVESSTLLLRNCDVVYNEDNGLRVKDAEVTAYNCRINDNGMNGIYSDRYKTKLYNCIVARNNQQGIFVNSNNDSLVVINAVIVDNNSTGIFSNDGKVVIKNSIIYNNETQINYAGTAPLVSYCDVEGGYDGTGNITSAPDFLETDFYTLSNISLCIDSGDPASSYDDCYFPPSQGAARNDMGTHGGPAAGRWYNPLYVHPLIVDFGKVRRDSTKSIPVVVKNYTDTILTVSDITLTGTDADNFSADTASFALAVYDSLAIMVSFTPDRSGLFTADMEIVSDQGSENIGLSGTGVVPNIFISGDHLDFAEVALGDSLALSVTVTNTGTDTLKLFDVYTVTSYFSATPAYLVIPPAQSEMIDVLFKPDTSRIYQDTLAIRSNDPDPGENPSYIALSGTGKGPLIAVVIDSIHFNQVRVTEDSVVSFSIANLGNADLVVDTIYVAGIYNNAFRITDQIVPLVISPAAGSLDVAVEYKPDQRAYHEAVLKIPHNDLLADTIEIALTGRGIAPELTIKIDELDLGKVAVDSSKTSDFYVCNTGEVDLTITKLELREGNDDLFELESLLQTDPIIMANESTLVALTVAPQDTGYIWSTIYIGSDDPIVPYDSITVSAIGTAPLIWFESKTFDFGSVAMGTASKRNIPIENKGDATLFIDRRGVYVANKNGFSCPLPQDLVLKPDSSSDAIAVTFSPEDSVLYESNLVVISNDKNSSPDTIKLTGSGYDPSQPIIQVTPGDTLDFSKVTVQSSRDSTVEISNTGDKELSVTSLQLTGNSAFKIKSSDKTFDVQAKQKKTITITFNSEIPLGLKTDQLQIESDDAAGNSPYIVNLVGKSIKDESPASISMDPSSARLTAGKADTLKFIIKDTNTKIESAFISLRLGGEKHFIPEPQKMQASSGDAWHVPVSADMVTARGLEYVIEAYHGGTKTGFPVEGFEAPAALTVVIPEMTFPAQTLKNFYQMISIPFAVQNNDLAALFDDDLGSYDNKRFRLFDWEPEKETYVELTDMKSSLPSGKALWLITREEIQLDVADGISIPTDASYTVALHQGWNMIANPFMFPVDWLAIDPTNVLHYYSGQEWVMETIIEPFKGYAVYAVQDTIITIPPMEAEAVQKVAHAALFPQAVWYLQVSAEKGAYYDRHNYIGVYKEDSAASYYCNIPEPPVIGKAVSLYAMHPDLASRRFSTDFQMMGQQGYQFSLRATSNFAGKTAIHFNPVHIPDNFEWVAVSPALHMKYPKGKIYTESNDHRIDVFIGTQSYLTDNLHSYREVPRTFDLGQNFPNPFNPVTTIKYQVPRMTKVTLEIYNVLGKRVIVLEKDALREPGYYQIKWNGTNQKGVQVASGLYILTLQSEAYFKAIKMILQK